MVEEGEYPRRGGKGHYRYRVPTGIIVRRHYPYAQKQQVAERIRWCSNTLGVNAHAHWNHRFEPRIAASAAASQAYFFFDSYEHAVAFMMRWK